MTNSSLKTHKPNLTDLLELFRFSHTAQTVQLQIKEAIADNLSHLDFLERILSQEAALKHQRLVEARIRNAKLPVIKTIDNFDWAHPTSIPKQLILNHFSLQFVEDKQNFVFIGPSGVGKTHIALALAHAACQNEIRTLWTTAADMVNALSAARSDHTVARSLKHYTVPKLLVIDELGFLPLDKDGSDLFFQVISHRYEQGSVVLTTNRAFKDWGKIFNDNTVASAIIDRLVDHSDAAKIEGPSYRIKNRKRLSTQSAG
jgi:DNA replication protein DnaC